jgi:hypothetical protein
MRDHYNFFIFFLQEHLSVEVQVELVQIVDHQVVLIVKHQKPVNQKFLQPCNKRQKISVAETPQL